MANSYDGLTKEQKYQKFLDRIAGGEKVISLPTNNISPEEKRYIEGMMKIRPLVVWLYHIQKERIAQGNLVCAVAYNKMGFDAGEKITKKDMMEILEVPPMINPEDIPDDETEEEEKERLKKERKKFILIKYITKEYKLVTNGLISLKDKVDALTTRESKIITEDAELVLIDNYINLARIEKDAEFALKNRLSVFGEASKWLQSINGVGPRLTGYLLAFLNPYRARHASCYISYCGLAVEPDGKATNKSHKVIREFINKKGELDYKDSIKFADSMKSKIITCVKLNFIKFTSPYRKFFDVERQKCLRVRKMDPKKQKGWIYNRSIRLPAKQFLIDFWLFHRMSEGLPITEPYEVAKLKMHDHRAD